MRKKWGQTEYRDHLWRCASATTIPEFEHLMKEFSEYDKEACQWLKQIPPVHWARSHFSGNCICLHMVKIMCFSYLSALIVCYCNVQEELFLMC